MLCARHLHAEWRVRTDPERRSGQSTVIRAYPRIHVTLLDMNGALGRINGGIGFAIDRPAWELQFRLRGSGRARSTAEGGTNQEHARIAAHLARLRREFGGGAVRVVIHSRIPSHVGLGSGTALLMAVTEGFFLANEIPHDQRGIIAASGRGRTSGIGVTTYFSGGFVFDVGHRLQGHESASARNISFDPSGAGVDRGAARVLLRAQMPDWEVLVLQSRRPGPSEAEERRFFSRTCPIPAQEVERVVRIVTMLAVPSVLEADAVGFGRALGLIQQCHWKRAEIGWHGRKQAHLIELLNRACGATFGMSSLGPSLFCVAPDVEGIARTAAAMLDTREWSVLRARPRNRGRDVEMA